MDVIGSVTETISSIASPPAQQMSSLLADQIAPDYWIPNAQIIVRKKLHMCCLSLFLYRNVVFVLINLAVLKEQNITVGHVAKEFV